MMRVRTVVVSLAALALAACSASGLTPAPASGPLLRDAAAPRELAYPEPPVVTPVHRVATVVLEARINRATGLPVFLYNGAAVVPTIRIRPGDTIVVDLHNELPASGGMASELNLHFHGLGVSPNPPADDVLTTLAMPGGTLHYVVPVPKNQQPGLYWYHPHVYMQTDAQVGIAGISGAIVVDGLNARYPALRKMTERLAIVRDVAPAAAGNAMRMHPHEEQNDNPCGPDPGLTPTVNGAVQPTVAIGRGEAQFFRVVNATGHKNLKLAVDGTNLNVIAIDGYALDVNPSGPAVASVSSLVVPPAGRAEFVVYGPASGSSELRTLCYDSGPGGDPDPMVVLAHLRAPKGSRTVPATHLRAARAASFVPLPPPAATRTVVLNEDDNGMYVNGVHFAMNQPPMYTVKAGTVERWNIVNITEEVHDFHMHQTHFLVESVNGSPVAHPYWADSVVVPHRTPTVNGAWNPGYVTLLIDFRDPVIRGEFMFHCHILDHEDAGMMAKIKAI